MPDHDPAEPKASLTTLYHFMLCLSLGQMIPQPITSVGWYVLQQVIATSCATHNPSLAFLAEWRSLVSPRLGSR